jgi:membrane protease YdiL (CAAX protease family)
VAAPRRSGGRAGPSPWERLGEVVRRLPDRATSGVVVVALVGINLVRHLLHPPWWGGPLAAAALLGFARLSGLSWAQLGLSRGQLRSGWRWGGTAVGLVAVVYLVGVLLPQTRPAFRDDRYHLPLPETLGTAFVVIPLGTVVLEEIAFRSVLWGVLARHLRPGHVLVTTSVLFGLWHLFPSLSVAAGNEGVSAAVGDRTVIVVLGTVALTTVGGLVFGELRRRSDSVLAPAALHWATNALGVLFGVAAWRLT